MYVSIYVCVCVCVSISIMEEHFLPTKDFQHTKENLPSVCKHTERVAVLKNNVVFQNFVQDFLIDFSYRVFNRPCMRHLCSIREESRSLLPRVSVVLCHALPPFSRHESLYRLLLPPAVKSWCATLQQFKQKLFKNPAGVKTPIGF